MASRLEQEIRALARPASLAQLGGFRPPEDPLWSWFGRINVGLPGDEWPLGLELPMLPLCQLSLRQAPHVPEALRDIALITIWVDQQTLPTGSPAPNGHCWCLRAYESLDGLVPITEPAERDGFLERPFPILWQALDADYPDWEDLAGHSGDELDEYHELDLTASFGTKLGGWPSLVQSEIFWAPWNDHPARPEYVLQVDSEEKAGWMWADCGVGYFGRGTGEHRDTWTLEWQCY